MDRHNLFHTRATYALERLDYLIGLVAFVCLGIAHRGEVDWWRFAAAFAWIDLVGFAPGAVAYVRAHRVAPVYTLLYNFTHSFTTNAAVLVAWMAVAGGWEWAMLAAPIHLCGDRALFGNIYKPFGLDFYGVAHPSFARFAGEFRGAARA